MYNKNLSLMSDAIYGRQSVDKADSISIESQIDFCKYETRGGKYKEYIDRGFSGKDTNRPGFEKMLQDVKKGIIKRVIVYKLDRISRSILDFCNMMETFQKYNVEFVSYTEKFDTSTPIGRAMLNICIVFAQLERETIQKRVSDAYFSRSRKGFYMGGRTPYGFKRENITIGGINTSKYVEVPEEVEQLRLMYSIYAEPLSTLGDILRYFKSRNIKHLRGKIWNTARISEMLRNPAYVRADSEIYNFFKSQGTEIINNSSDFAGINGCYLYSKKDEPSKLHSLSGKTLVLAPHEGVISSSDWLKARIKIMNNKQVATTNKVKNSWLVGKTKCGVCGYALVIRKSDRRRKNVVRYFICSNNGIVRHCKGCGTVRAEDLESLILNKIKERLTEFKIIQSNENNINSVKINEYKLKIADIENEINGLLEKVKNANDILMKYINDKITELDTQRKQIYEALLKLSNEAEKTDVKKLENCVEHWDETTFDDKRRIVDTLIKVIRISEGKLDIEWKV